MYSLVLMSAMTPAPDAAGFNGYFRDLFNRGGNCSGCSGSCGGTPVRYSCVGGGCSGATSYATGCCGGEGGLFSGDRVRRLFDRGGGCCGGYARSLGCSGASYSCFGSGYGCSGSGYGCSGLTSYSCSGGPAVGYTPVFTGGLSCQGGVVPSAPAPTFDPYPTAPGGPPATIPYADPRPTPPATGQEAGGVRAATGFGVPVGASGGARATVTVRLPADAKLFADGTALKMTGGERKFVTPPLPAGMEYTYRFTVEYDRDGRTLSEARNVAVRAGGTAGVEFADLTASASRPPVRDAAADPATNPVAEKPAALTSLGGSATGAGIPTLAPAPTAGADGRPAKATITVKVPPGATLYVDDRKSPSMDPVRRFTTPPLPAGREFSYLLRVEQPTRDGQPERMTERVTFRAGEETTIDFTTVGGR